MRQITTKGYVTMTRINIADGITLNIIKSDRFKTNLLKINFTLPLSEETAPYAALLPMVLRRGCDKYPTMLEFNRRLEYLYETALGGGASKIGENEAITFNASFLRNELIPDGTDLLSDVIEMVSEFLFKPYLVDGAFFSEYVESEKKNLCDRIEAEINNKGSYALKRLIDVMCEKEAYSVSALGTVDSVSKITARKLFDFYQNELSKAPVEIFFVGTCDEDELREKLCEVFSPFKRNAVGYTESTVIEEVTEVKRVVEEMPVNQGKLTMGFRTGAYTAKKNGYIFTVFNEIFGGSPTSKLFENVREKMSLCYYCSSRSVAPKGIMYISSGVKVGDEKRAEDEIMRQLEAMKAGEFSDRDIELAKISIKNLMMSSYDDADRLASGYLHKVITGAELVPIEETIEKIETVTREQIVEIANTVKLDTVYFLKGTNLDGGDDGDEE